MSYFSITYAARLFILFVAAFDGVNKRLCSQGCQVERRVCYNTRKERGLFLGAGAAQRYHWIEELRHGRAAISLQVKCALIKWLLGKSESCESYQAAEVALY